MKIWGNKSINPPPLPKKMKADYPPVFSFDGYGKSTVLAQGFLTAGAALCFYSCAAEKSVFVKTLSGLMGAGFSYSAAMIHSDVVRENRLNKARQDLSGSRPSILIRHELQGNGAATIDSETVTRVFPDSHKIGSADAEHIKFIQNNDIGIKVFEDQGGFYVENNSQKNPIYIAPERPAFKHDRKWLIPFLPIFGITLQKISAGESRKLNSGDRLYIPPPHDSDTEPSFIFFSPDDKWDTTPRRRKKAKEEEESRLWGLLPGRSVPSSIPIPFNRLQTQSLTKTSLS